MAAYTYERLVARGFTAVVIAVAMASCSPASRSGGRDAETAARALLEGGDTASAIEHLERAHLERRRDPALFATLGSLYRTRGTIDGRLRSQRHLERALQLFPDDPRVLMELGRTYYAQTFYPDAEKCFRSALAIDPGLCDAHYFLGVYHYDKWKRVNAYTDDLDTARGAFARAIACDPQNADAARRYAFALYARGHADSAVAVCDTMVDRFPERAEFRLLRGAVAYDREQYDAAAADFAAGVALLDEETRSAYDDVGTFIPVSERDAYAAAPPAPRAVYDRAFWIDADPDPTTERNERALEHTYRVFLADLFYSCAYPRRRGWETERGQTLIKFGWPDSVESNMGGSWKDGRAEKWTYDAEDTVLEFVFVDEYLNGNLRIPYRADAMVGILRYAPLVTDYESEAAAVPGTMDIVAFKDSDMSGSLCIALRVDADSLVRAADIARTNHFHFRGVVFDDDWLPETRFADTLWTSETVARSRRGLGPVYDVVRVVPVAFDNYHVACTFQDALGRAAARFRADADAYRFVGDQLTLSDILLESAADTGAVFVRGERTLHPNTGRRYRSGERLDAYFEVYNLRVAQGRSDYSVTFLIFEAPETPPPAWRRWGGRLAGLVGADRAPSISQTFERSGTAHREGEEVAINVDTLADGRYELVVSVEDAVSGERAEARTAFYKGPDE
jgi:GWxTD domain-containing protein